MGYFLWLVALRGGDREAVEGGGEEANQVEGGPGTPAEQTDGAGRVAVQTQGPFACPLPQEGDPCTWGVDLGPSVLTLAVFPVGPGEEDSG